MAFFCSKQKLNLCFPKHLRFWTCSALSYMTKCESLTYSRDCTSSDWLLQIQTTNQAQPPSEFSSWTQNRPAVSTHEKCSLRPSDSLLYWLVLTDICWSQLSFSVFSFSLIVHTKQQLKLVRLEPRAHKHTHSHTPSEASLQSDWGSCCKTLPTELMFKFNQRWSVNMNSTLMRD